MLKGGNAIVFVETRGPQRGRQAPPRRCGAAAKQGGEYCAAHDRPRQRRLQELYAGLLHPSWEHRLDRWHQMKGPLEAGAK